jgi:hypothetical protein
MGEAKRRKQHDPAYGQCNVRISIRESAHTNNYLVMVDEIVADSSIHYEEAFAIQQWMEVELILNPIKRHQLTAEGVCKWITSSSRIQRYPETTAEIMTFNTQTGERGTATVTITGDDIIKEFCHD